MGKSLTRLDDRIKSCISHDAASGPDAVFNMSIRSNKRDEITGPPAMPDGDFVQLIEVCAGDQAERARRRAEDLAVFPGRHVIVARPRHAKAEGGPRPDQIIAFAAVRGARLIVAGGHGHAWRRKRAMGGASHRLPDRSAGCRLLNP